MDQPYLVTGREGTGAKYLRFEVRELQKKPEQFALFVLGLRALYGGTSPPEFPRFPHIPSALLWENIGAIHGKPYDRWVGDPQGVLSAPVNDDPDDGSPDFGGYCNHQSVLFPTWHRPVILLAEQGIGYVADHLANNIPGRNEKWILAAKELRFPFWDWLDPRTRSEGLPPILWSYKIPIRTPAGGSVDLDNPLKAYPISEELRVKLPVKFQQYNRTMRHPTSPTQEDYDTLNKQLKDSYDTVLKEKVDLLFTFPDNLPPEQWATTWDQFSNTDQQSGKVARRASVESPHNSVHNILGGRGHMANANVAGFDPIFYLHHAFVDNLIDRWMSRYPKYWMGLGWHKPNSGKLEIFHQPGATFPYAPLSTPRKMYDINEKSDLFPFRTKKGDYWTSIDAKQLPYYKYPRALVDQLVFNPVDEAALLEKRSHSGLFGLDGLIHEFPDAPEGYTRVDHYLHFIISVELLEHAFDGSYTLSLYSQQTGQLIGAADVFHS